MSFRPYIIEVSGNIIIKEGKHYAQDWVALSAFSASEHKMMESEYNESLHSFTGDLFLDNHKRAVPYAHYLSKGDTEVKGISSNVDLLCAPGFFPAFAYFEEYIEEIRSGFVLITDRKVKGLYYNGLYVSVFSILELFLCDFLMCGMFSNEAYYNKALAVLKISDSDDQVLVEKKIKNIVFNKVFHRFDDINCIFFSVFGFNLPSYDDLKEKLHRRDNIVHRYALSKIDRMSVCDASPDDVIDLIKEVVRFVNDIKFCAV